MNESGENISIVDDDAHSRRSIARLLNAFGLPVLSFGLPKEFLDSPSLLDTACLISSVNLATSSGRELQESLARLDLRIPTIFVSEFGDAPWPVAAGAGSALGYLNKPVAPGKLLRLIRSVMPADKVLIIDRNYPGGQTVSESSQF